MNEYLLDDNKLKLINYHIKKYKFDEQLKEIINE